MAKKSATPVTGVFDIKDIFDESVNYRAWVGKYDLVFVHPGPHLDHLHLYVQGHPHEIERFGAELGRHPGYIWGGSPKNFKSLSIQ